MSESSLYNKWRPHHFKEFVGQPIPVKILQSMIINNRLRNAYLLYGMHGSGKTSLARVFANAVNCQHPNAYVRPCGQCQYCLSHSMDIVEIDAATSTGIDDVRSLRERVMYLPEIGQKRIYIIDEIHRFSGSAFDALLKMIEEPPPHIIFMLATTELDKIPETIKSRCVLIPFRSAAIGEIEEHISNIARAEGISIDQHGVHIIAGEAAGSMRDAIKLLDQMAIDPSSRIRTEDIQQFTGMINKDLVKAIVKAMLTGVPLAAIDSINTALEAGAIPAKLAQQIAEAAHSRLIYSINNGAINEYAILNDMASGFSDLVKNNTKSIEKIDIEILALKLAGKQSNYFTLDTFISQWNNGAMEEVLSRYTKLAANIIQSCSPIEYNNGVLSLMFYSPDLAKSMQSGNKLTILERALQELESIPIKVRITS